MPFITTELHGAVEIITIDRQEALNALNPDVLSELKAAFDSVDQSSVHCIVLTGAGEKSFVAGADIGLMSKMTKSGAEAFSKLGNDIFLGIETFPIPVIAAVNGFALGGGCELAMSCDIRVCSDNAVFGQPEVGLGITPGFGGTQRLARLVGTGMATLDGGRIGIAAQALGIAEGAIEETVKYVNEREQFGRKIAAFQNTQFELADMYARTKAAQYLVYAAACKKDEANRGAKIRYSIDAAML